MTDSTKERESAAPDVRMQVAPAARRGGKYHPLYAYLKSRYADTVVLTFQQVEDLLGSALPDTARHDADWWRLDDRSTAEIGGVSAWALASRTARANLGAQIVTSDRLS